MTASLQNGHTEELKIKSSAKTIDSLQMIRGIAFLIVFIRHATYICPGSLGVSLFFVLSSFVMVYSYWDRPPAVTLKGAGLFMVKKIKRLYPLHLIMLAVGVGLMVLEKFSVISILKRLAVTAALIQTWFPTTYNAVNSVSWYFSVCVLLYFLFPFILAHIKRTKSVSACVMRAVVLILMQIAVGYFMCNILHLQASWIAYRFPIYRIPDFYIGCSLAYIFKHFEGLKLGAVKASVLEFVAIILNVVTGILYFRLSGWAHFMKFTCVYLPVSAFTIYVFAYGEGIFSKLLTNKVAMWLADISAYSYLIHRLVINYLVYILNHLFGYDTPNDVLVAIIAFAVTVALNYIYAAAERRIKARRRGRCAA